MLDMEHTTAKKLAVGLTLEQQYVLPSITNILTLKPNDEGHRSAQILALICSLSI